MPYNDAQNPRTRRLRAKYRKKMTVVAIVALLIGLALGFALCILSLNQGGFTSRLFKLGPTDLSAANQPNISIVTPEPEAEEPTPEPLESEETQDEQPSLTFQQSEAEPEDVDSEDEAPEDEAEPSGDEPDEGEAPEEDASLITAITATEAPAEAATPEPTEAPTAEPTPEPTEEPTPEPTEAPTPAPTAAPEIVPFGQAYSLQTEIDADGKARMSAGEEPFEVLDLTIKVDDYRGPDYFQEQYATKYILQGTEAVVQFELTVNGYTGSTTLMPNAFIPDVTMMGATPDVTNEGYQLMNAEIGGDHNVEVTPGVTTTLYKRYVYCAEQGDMVYMVVPTYQGGVARETWFEVLAPEPVATPTPEAVEANAQSTTAAGSDAATGAAPNATEAVASGTELTRGSKGDEVSRLQSALIAKGVLTGPPDGQFGKYTADAVRIMQGRYGMEQTGIADAAFLQRLYADQ